MNPELYSFAAHMRGLIANRQSTIGNRQFSELALELFSLQFKHNAAYRKSCEVRQLTPQAVEYWAQIPAMPTSAFKELEISSIPTAERAAVFHSSGTTEQKPSRHFHCPESLSVYETSLWTWFESNLISNLKLKTKNLQFICLAPSPEQAPHSSLVYMFEAVRQKFGGASVPASRSEFLGKLAADGAWTLDYGAVKGSLFPGSQTPEAGPSLMLGTAFSFVHLLDYLAERNLRFELPAGSRVMETGGYKNRSRSLPKAELHALITERLGVPRENIICEYGMSELSSQAYDAEIYPPSSILHPRVFRFPPWSRVQIISPESGREVAEGEAGLIRIFDLANVFSVAAIQTEDLGVRRGDGFELIGRAQLAEPRGCSLMAA